MPPAAVGVEPYVRMINDLDQADQQQYLNRHRDHGGERAVMCFFVQQCLFIGHLVRVAEILNLQPVHGRLQPDHLDAVCMHPEADGQQNQLCHEGEHNHSQAVIAGQAVSHPHQPPQRCADYLHTSSLLL